MYRNDHVAARARVRALEIELDRARKLEHELESATRAESNTASMPSTTRLTIVIVGVGAIALVTVIALGAHLSSRSHRNPSATAMSAPPPTRIVADRVIDEGISRATDLAPGAKLVDIAAEGILGDGTIDPTYGKVEVELIRDNGPDPGPTVDPTKPIGAPMPERFYFQYDCIHLVYEQGRWRDQATVMSSNFERLHSCFHSLTERPPVARQCSVQQVVTRARAAAPATALAHISLDATGWMFAIEDPRFRVRLHVDDDCTGRRQ